MVCLNHDLICLYEYTNECCSAVFIFSLYTLLKQNFIILLHVYHLWGGVDLTGWRKQAHDPCALPPNWLFFLNLLIIGFIDQTSRIFLPQWDTQEKVRALRMYTSERWKQKQIDFVDGDSDHFEQLAIDRPFPREGGSKPGDEESRRQACPSATNIPQLDKNKRGH